MGSFNKRLARTDRMTSLPLPLPERRRRGHIMQLPYTRICWCQQKLSSLPSVLRMPGIMLSNERPLSVPCGPAPIKAPCVTLPDRWTLWIGHVFFSDLCPTYSLILSCSIPTPSSRCPLPAHHLASFGRRHTSSLSCIFIAATADALLLFLAFFSGEFGRDFLKLMWELFLSADTWYLYEFITFILFSIMKYLLKLFQGMASIVGEKPQGYFANKKYRVYIILC